MATSPPPLVRAPTAQPSEFAAPPFDAPPAAPAPTAAAAAAPLTKKASGFPSGGVTNLTNLTATSAHPPPPAALGPPPFKPYKRAVRPSPAGCAVYAAYLAGFAFYLWVRITKTLGLGRYTPYGAVVLAVECLGATTVLIYGLNLILLPAPTGPPPASTANPYHVRVCVPVYKEALDIVRRTILAARAAPLPSGCARTVYLCDDGRDPKKRSWVAGLNDPCVVYVSGRKRAPGEINGKSGNINNLLAQLYGGVVPGVAPDIKHKDGGVGAPPRPTIPGTELLCIFDADQVASSDFFTQTLHLFDGGDDVGMVLSPQCFHNLSSHADIFNHSNVHFWEYSQVGYDALGFISCTGTNFLVRSQALLEVGGSPAYTLTEDFALGMELKRAGWHCRYFSGYLAIGEAPHEVRNIFQQRSRWCKGHFQIFFSRHCPLVVPGLSPLQRILYCSGVWSYVVGALTTPFFMAVPIVTIWGGVFPIVVSWWAALAISVQVNQE